MTQVHVNTSLSVAADDACQRGAIFAASATLFSLLVPVNTSQTSVLQLLFSPPTISSARVVGEMTPPPGISEIVGEWRDG